MSELIERAKAAVSRSFIESEFGDTDSKWSGNNYQTTSPLRIDHNPGSFSIREDGVYFDRADGGSTGDIIKLLMETKSMTAKQAALYILGESEEYHETARAMSQEEKSPGSEEEEDEGEPEETTEKLRLSWLPIPGGKVPQFGTPPDYLTLFHVHDEAAFYIVRYNAPEHNPDDYKEEFDKAGKKKPPKKIIYPLYWNGSQFEKGFPEELKKHRPLLRFDKDKVVILVEGEKCATEGAKAFPQYSWTCWHGGTSVVKHVDYSDLHGCNVVIWPDNDIPGEVAADYLCGRLDGVHPASLRRIVPPLGKDKGWDVADAILEKWDCLGLIEDSVIIDTTGLHVDAQSIVEPHVSGGRAYTDMGNAERFIDMWGHVLRYNTDKNKWMIWHEGHWKDSDQTAITPMIKRTLRGIALTDNKPEALFWARKSEASRGINSMLTLAKMEPGVPICENDLDRDMYYMNCANGVVDLRTGEFMKAKPEWLCYKKAGTKYNPDARCPIFQKFLTETFSDDDGVINFIQRWLGYSLTADVSAQTFAVFHGIGANGKSTLVETIQRIAGDYVKTAPPDTFIQKLSGGIPNDIAALRGARMVLTTETEANARLAEAKVKSMTGGDRVSARYMRGEFFEFTPTWKITISTNHRPRISGGDYGIWRRVVLVPFNNVVTPEKQDPLLPNKLLSEAEGILAWCIRGAINWYSSSGGRTGLQVPETVYAETQEYREDEDVIGRFIALGCMGPEEVRTKVSKQILRRPGSTCAEVFHSFRYWAEKEGEEGYSRWSQTMFGRAMRERGFMSERTSSDRYYQGIVPKDEFRCIAEGVLARYQQEDNHYGK